MQVAFGKAPTRIALVCPREIVIVHPPMVFTPAMAEKTSSVVLAERDACAVSAENCGVLGNDFSDDELTPEGRIARLTIRKVAAAIRARRTLMADYEPIGCPTPGACSASTRIADLETHLQISRDLNRKYVDALRKVAAYRAKIDASASDEDAASIYSSALEAVKLIARQALPITHL